MSRRYDRLPRPICISPAPGWWAAYTDKGGKRFLQPLAVWLLDSDGDISGIDLDSDGVSHAAERVNNFDGYVYAPGYQPAAAPVPEAVPADA